LTALREWYLVGGRTGSQSSIRWLAAWGGLFMLQTRSILKVVEAESRIIPDRLKAWSRRIRLKAFGCSLAIWLGGMSIGNLRHSLDWVGLGIRATHGHFLICGHGETLGYGNVCLVEDSEVVQDLEGGCWSV
jgi:hypothetical protein